VPLLGVAGANAYIYRPRFVLYSEGAGNPRVRPVALAGLERRFNRTLVWETGLAVLVLLVVALLVQMTPTRGRLGEAGSEGPFTGAAEAGDIAATLRIDPNLPGDNTFEVYLSGGVNTVESVRINLEQPSDPFSQSRLDMEASAPPFFYVGRGPVLTNPGLWEIEIDLRRSAEAGSDLVIPFEVEVPAAPGQVTARGGGAFEAPVEVTAVTAALLALSGMLSLAIVVASLRRPGLPAGYMGLFAADVVARASAFRLRSATSLAGLLIIGTGLGLLLGSHVHGRLSPEEAAKGNPIPATAESIERGRLLYMQNCTQCHGETGRGDGPLAETLPLPPANFYLHVPYHPDEFFFQAISNGFAGAMPAFADSISEEDRWNLLNFLRDQFGQPPVDR
jgi:mono/diheme cytochrome c family protein